MTSATLPEEHLLELITQLQKTTPDQVKAILNPQPAIANALLKLMIKMDLIQGDSLMHHLSEVAGAASLSASVPAPNTFLLSRPPPQPIPPNLPPHVIQSHNHSHTPTPPPASVPYQQYHAPTPHSRPGFYAPQQEAPSLPKPNANYYPHPPPPVQNTLPEVLAHLPEDQKATMMQIIAMTPAQIQQLHPAERAGIVQLRMTLGLPSE